MTDRRRTHAPWVFLLLIVLAIPRIARMVYPQVWIEDESYLNGAFLISRGLAPYRDFPLPHFPVLESVLAAIFTVAPASIRSAEAFTAAAAFGGSVLVFLVGKQIAGRTMATTASLIFATSSLLFRYHLFEREVFDVVPALAAVWIVGISRADTRDRPYDLGTRILRGEAAYVAAGLLLAAAMAIKLTAFAVLAGVVAQLVLEKRTRGAAIVVGTAAAAILLASIPLAIAFGSDFLVQVVVFRAVHASFPSLGVKLDELRYTLDLAFATGVAGVVYIGWAGRARQYLAPLLQLISGFGFLVLLNPTYWAHSGIELLPWLALCGGALIVPPARRADLKARRADLKVRTTGGRTDLKVRTTAWWACAVLAVLLLVFVSPVMNLNWQAGDGSVYGFGYRDRAEIEQAASFVRAHTADGDPVATPPIVAFAANRREVVPYAELSGDLAELTDAVRRDGYAEAISGSRLRAQTFWEGVEASRARVAPIIDEAVRTRRVGAVVNYSDADLFPIALVDVDRPTLEGSGYELASKTPHYEIWLRR